MKIGGLTVNLPKQTMTLDKIQSIKDPQEQQLALAKYQEQNQMRQQMVAFLSQYLKSNHESSMAIIRNT